MLDCMEKEVVDFCCKILRFEDVEGLGVGFKFSVNIYICFIYIFVEGLVCFFVEFFYYF